MIASKFRLTNVTRFLACAMFAIVTLVATAAPSVAAPLVPPEAVEETGAVRADFRNEWCTAAPDAQCEPPDATTFFGGELWGEVGTLPPIESDCCHNNGTPGCSDSSCQDLICSLDSYCCNTEWNNICAGLAGDYPTCSAGCGTPYDGQHYLVQSSFGQPFAKDVPYEGFIDDAREKASMLLYHTAAGTTPGENCSDDYGSGVFCQKNAAFRYKDLLYGEDTCLNAEGACDPTQVVNLIEAREKNMTYFYGPAERNRLVEAEIFLRDALKYAPFNHSLRNDLLDLYYNRIVAELSLAKEKLVEATHRRLAPPPAGGFVVSNEIAGFENTLGEDQTPGGMKFAELGYFELLKDTMGVDVCSIDPEVSCATAPPFGYYMFQKEVPSRSLYEATYIPSPGDDPVPVTSGVWHSVTDYAVGAKLRPTTTNGHYYVAQQAGTSALGEPAWPIMAGEEVTDGTVVWAEAGPASADAPMPLFSGYKDLVLLFNLLRDYADTTVELSRRYIMRGTEADIEDAKSLVVQTHQRLLFDGQILLSIFPDGLPAAGHPSGVAEAITGWQGGLSRLTEVRNFINGDTNILGFSPDFMMFVEAFSGQDQVFDSYDALLEWLEDGPQAPLTRAVDKYDDAVTSYDTYRGANDQLQTQFSTIGAQYNTRLFEIVGANRGDPGYDTPQDNEGSLIALQRIAIDIAINRITKNSTQSSNLEKQIQIEVTRRGKEQQISEAIKQLHLEFGDKQVEFNEWLGAVSAQQATAQAFADANSDMVTGLDPIAAVEGLLAAAQQGLNGSTQVWGEKEKARIEGLKEKYSAALQADLTAESDQLLDANSEALVKTLSLQRQELAIDSLEQALLLVQEQARLAGLWAEKADIERKMDEANALLAGRYFADPIHRLRSQAAMVEADAAFDVAQRWLFFTVRALEFKWNEPFVKNDGTRDWSLSSVFSLRNATELESMLAAMILFDGEKSGIAKDSKQDTFSVREDFFGFNEYDANGQLQLHMDPETGDLLTATEAFRRKLENSQNANGSIILDFSTVRELPGGSFFKGPTYAPGGGIKTAGSYLDKIERMRVWLPGNHSLGFDKLEGSLTYGGTAFVRNPVIGQVSQDSADQIEGEMTAYSTRHWKKVGTEWRAEEALEADVSMVLGNGTICTDNPTCIQPYPSCLCPDAIDSGTFQERSVAATGWRLIIPTVDQSTMTELLKIEELDDIELVFFHQSYDR